MSYSPQLHKTMIILARCIAIVATVFILELTADHILLKIMPDKSVAVNLFADSVFLILFSTPLIWLLVYRPLQTLALSGKEQFEHLFMQMVDAIVITDLEGKISSCNPAAEVLFAVSAHELSGTPIQRLISAPKGKPLISVAGTAAPDSVESGIL